MTVEYVVEDNGARVLVGYDSEHEYVFVAFRGSYDVQNYIDDLDALFKAVRRRTTTTTTRRLAQGSGPRSYPTCSPALYPPPLHLVFPSRTKTTSPRRM